MAGGGVFPPNPRPILKANIEQTRRNKVRLWKRGGGDGARRSPSKLANSIVRIPRWRITQSRYLHVPVVLEREAVAAIVPSLCPPSNSRCKTRNARVPAHTPPKSPVEKKKTN